MAVIEGPVFCSHLFFTYITMAVCELALAIYTSKTAHPPTPHTGTTTATNPPAATRPPTADQQQCKLQATSGCSAEEPTTAPGRAGCHPPAAKKSRNAKEVWGRRIRSRCELPEAAHLRSRIHPQERRRATSAGAARALQTSHSYKDISQNNVNNSM